MAIVTEYPWNGRTDRIRYVSDDGHEIVNDQTGSIHGEIIAVYPPKNTYSEAETYIPTDGGNDHETAYNELKAKYES